MSRVAWLLPTAALIGASVIGACSSSSHDDGATGNTCAPLQVDRFKELVIVDEGVLNDARAKNASDGVWSFRHAMENMAPPNVDPSEFVRDWLTSWVTTTTVNGYSLEVPDQWNPPPDRVGNMNANILCPWIKRSPANGCADTDKACETCTAKKLDLAVAPFKLIAITNRMDLREQVADEPAGEGRLVFAAMKGDGDDESTQPANMSVIVEYRHPDSKTPLEWAQTWHALGQFTSYDEPFRAALENVTNSFTKRGMNPAGINGSALGQIRTNDSVLGWRWQLREFSFEAGGALRPAPLRNTPSQTLNNKDILTQFVTSNAPAIKASKFEMPITLRTGSADRTQVPWTVPGVDEATRKAFAANTCNGCHFDEEKSLDSALHISPLRKGIDKLSPFMNTPGQHDELTARSESLQRALCVTK